MNCKYFFCNFWDGFSGSFDIINEGFFIDHIFPFLDRRNKVQNMEDANLIIYSCFGNHDPQKFIEMKAKGAVIVQWTGEARFLDPDFEYTDILLGSNINDANKNIYSFLSLLYLKAQRGRLGDNLLSQVEGLTLEKRKFCAMFCGALRSPRQEIYDVINRYKPVDGFGFAFHKRAHGNYWDKGFLRVLSEYKFIIALENTFRNGYNTEKIINPLIAKTIPLYWGSSTVFTFVNPDRVLYINGDLSNLQEVLQQLIYLDNNDDAYNRMINLQPFLYDDLEVVDGSVTSNKNAVNTIINLKLRNMLEMRSELDVLSNIIDLMNQCLGVENH